MLQTIRDHTQGWLAGTIVSILILTFALWGISSYFTGGGSNAILAKVNGGEITKERFTLAFEQARRQLQAQQGSSSPLSGKQEAGLKENVLNELIVTEVLKQASIKDNYRVSAIQIDSYLENIPEFQDGGKFSLAKFQEVMASSLYSANDLIELVRTTLLVAQPKLGILLTSVALPDETKYTISLVNQERNLHYLGLTSSALPNQHAPQVTSDEIAAYYQSHQDEFKTPEQVSIDYLELSLKDVMSRINPTPEALKSFFNENINNYTQPAQWKLASIAIALPKLPNKQEIAAAESKAKDVLQKIRQGEDFGKYASQLTNDAVQAPLQGWVSVGQLPVDLQKPVLALTKANPISGVVQLEQGFVIVKLVEMRDTQVQPFDQVKAKVKEALVRQQAEEKMAALRDQLADLTYEHPDSLLAAAKALEIPVKTSVTFTKEKGGQDISSNKKIREAAFSSDVLSLQNNSEIVQINPETSIVVRIKAHQPPALLPLNSVLKQIQDRLQAEKTKNMISQMAEEINHKLQSGVSEAQISEQYHVGWNEVGFIGRYSNKVDSAIIDKAFRLPRSQKNSYGVVQLPGGFAVIALHAVRDGTVKDQKQYTLFAQQIQNSQGLLEYEIYKQSLMSKAKITVEKK